MRAWLMDAYRRRDSIALWMKTPDKDFILEKSFSAQIFIEDCPAAQAFLTTEHVPYKSVKRMAYSRKEKDVLLVTVPELSSYERFVRWIEQGTRHRVALYTADIAPEQMFLYKNNLFPCSAVEIQDNHIIPVPGDESIALTQADIKVIPSSDIRADARAPVKAIILNGVKIEGEERDVLERFAASFIRIDPDVMLMGYGFLRLPYLAARLLLHSIHCPFHRWDEAEIRYKGGRSFYSYGQVRYRDYAINLHGRFLVDTSTMVGSECDPGGIAELCQCSGARFQFVAAHSFGATFQSALVRQMVQENLLVPFKEKPVEQPFSLFELLKADRGAQTLDPKLGFHQDVAEIDFSSMFPWLIYNHNISAETIMCDEPPFDTVPGIPVRVSLQRKGLVPRAIKPLIDKRMEYKANPTAVNKARAVGLKWVLVTSYGYLRFREFKLGIPSSHMAICAYARETLLAAAQLAEEWGFDVVHGIVDSLFIQKKGITEKEAKDFCRELHMITGIPVSLEGIFKWAVFLASVQNTARPLPATYFGAFRNGEIKARGIDLRQKSCPLVVRYLQQKCLELMAGCGTREEIIALAPELCRLLRSTMHRLPGIKPEWLTSSIHISKLDYKNDIPQRKILKALQKKGIKVLPGQIIQYVVGKDGAHLPEDFSGRTDIGHYSKLLVRSLYSLLQQFGFTREMVAEMARDMRQMKLNEYG